MRKYLGDSGQNGIAMARRTAGSIGDTNVSLHEIIGSEAIWKNRFNTKEIIIPNATLHPLLVHAFFPGRVPRRGMPNNTTGAHARQQVVAHGRG